MLHLPSRLLKTQLNIIQLIPHKKLLNTSGKFSYTVYSNDPLQSRWYTLPNGLTVVMSVNKAEPRVQTLIATKAGSKNDPAENTGFTITKHCYLKEQTNTAL